MSVIKKLKLDKKGGSVPKRAGLFVLKTFVFTLTIVFTSLPVTALYFGSISALAPISNLIFIPAFSLILYFGWIVLILSPVPGVITAVSFAADKYISAVLWVLDKVASFDAAISLRYPFSPYILLLLSGAVIAASLAGKKIILKMLQSKKV